MLCGTLDCCPLVRAELGLQWSLGGGMRVACPGGMSVAARSVAGGSRAPSSARRASASGVCGEVSILVAVRAFW